MFNPFSHKQKNNKNVQIIFKITGMHCTSCAMNIDLELEDQKGVVSSKTNYAKSETTVSYDPNIISKKLLITIISKLGYETQ
jgi:P-type Cu+ transporter